MDKTLLIADDAMIIREMIRDAAEDAGWKVVALAQNGQEAVDLYDEHRPAAVTLDIVMPEYDGLYALRNIKEHNPDARVIMVSAVGHTSVLKEAIKSGASDFVVKPFDQGHLLDTLEKLIA